MPMLMNSVFAQDTLVAWTFPAASVEDSVANVYASVNSGRYLSCQYGTYGAPSYFSIHSDTTMGANPPSKCLMAADWANGADSAYWEVKFYTTNFEHLKLYSIQESDATFPGPRDFKVQYKLHGATTWTDISPDTIVCANNWTSGVVNGISIPDTCDNQSAHQVSIRWVQVSNLDINGHTLLSTGINKIDNIIITGTSTSGIVTDKESLVKVYPNPNNGNFFIENNGEISKIAIFNIIGKCVYTNENLGETRTDLSGFENGVYLVRIITKDNELLTRKIVVE